jgi:predicted TIM-barrel fold metal-dependent hydrolase
VDQPLTSEQAGKVIEKLKEMGKDFEVHSGHPDRLWSGPHVHVDGTHIPVEEGFKP